MELKRTWGIGYGLEYSTKEIRELLILSPIFPFGKRLAIVRYSQVYMVGYGFLPVTDPRDQANVAALEQCNATWYEERI